MRFCVLQKCPDLAAAGELAGELSPARFVEQELSRKGADLATSSPLYPMGFSLRSTPLTARTGGGGGGNQGRESQVARISRPLLRFAIRQHRGHWGNLAAPLRTPAYQENQHLEIPVA